MKKPNDTKVSGLIDSLLENKISLDKEKNKNRRISEQFSIENNLNKTLEIIKAIEQHK